MCRGIGNWIARVKTYALSLLNKPIQKSKNQKPKHKVKRAAKGKQKPKPVRNMAWDLNP